MNGTNTTSLEEMTLAELKARAKELGVEQSDVAPIEASGSVPVKADWLREIRRAETAASAFKPEWREAGARLVELWKNVEQTEEVAHARKLSSALSAGEITNHGLVALRDLVKATAAGLREADNRDLATRFSNANYLVRRAERATRR